jgi:cytochrome oxidase assembly protein ShyY1
VIRRPPILASVVVAAAVAIMISLGAWQLKRAKWKDDLLARYERAETLPPITWPTEPLKADELPLFRHATAVCLEPVGKRAVAGRNLSGEPGYVQILDCRTGPGRPNMSVEVGWSKNPNARVGWPGGLVSGVIAPDRVAGMRLVAASPAPGLEASAPPSIGDIPNNHLSYAIQWFAFAATALVIYALALRKRLREKSADQ